MDRADGRNVNRQQASPDPTAKRHRRGSELYQRLREPIADLKTYRRFLTPYQVAMYLGLSKSAITEWCRTGRLRAVRFGSGKLRNCWRIDPTDVLAYIDTHTGPGYDESRSSQPATGMANPT